MREYLDKILCKISDFIGAKIAGIKLFFSRNKMFWSYKIRKKSAKCELNVTFDMVDLAAGGPDYIRNHMHMRTVDLSMRLADMVIRYIDTNRLWFDQRIDERRDRGEQPSFSGDGSGPRAGSYCEQPVARDCSSR